MLAAIIKSVSTSFALLMTLPSPTLWYDLAFGKPSDLQHQFPVREIPASANVREFNKSLMSIFEQVPWKGKSIPASQFLFETKTQAFVAVKGGKIVHEWYAEGIDAKTRLPSYSVAKSIVSLLAGQTIDAGLLSEDALLVSVLPELKAGTEYDRITIRHLLDMQSGVDVSEEYAKPHGTFLMAITDDLNLFTRHFKDMKFAPGTKCEYRSVDTQLLGMAIARVEGRSLADLLYERIWSPIGAEDDATWNLDRVGGQEKAFCCINATARDFAKIGTLILSKGEAYGKQVISPAWLKRVSTPVSAVDGWHYTAQWWHFSNGTFGAVGIYGQYIFLDPRRNTVIVKLSNYGAEQDEKETVEALQAISMALHDLT